MAGGSPEKGAGTAGLEGRGVFCGGGIARQDMPDRVTCPQGSSGHGLKAWSTGSAARGLWTI